MDYQRRSTAGNRDGRLTYLRGSQPGDSVGMFYQAVTEALGFVPVDGEYKTMGLAAFGQIRGRANPFDGIVSVRDGVLASTQQWKAANYNERHPDRKGEQSRCLRSHKPTSFSACSTSFANHDVAAFAQAHFEDVMMALASDTMRLCGSSRLVAAGGVMLNVKANALIRDQLNPASFFVFPDSEMVGLRQVRHSRRCFSRVTCPPLRHSVNHTSGTSSRTTR